MSEGASLPVRIGDIVAGKYQVERVLGAAAMGFVVAAMHLDLHELLAIKSARPPWSEKLLHPAARRYT